MRSSDRSFLSHSFSLLRAIALALLVVFSGCTGSMHEAEVAQSASESVEPQPPAANVPPEEATPVPDESGDGGDGSGGTGNGGDGQSNPPVVTLLNISGGEYVRGGTTFLVYFKVVNLVEDPSKPDVAMSSVEYQRPGDAPNKWRPIQDKIVSLSGTVVEVPWAVCSPTDLRADCQGHVDGTGYKIRVSTVGLKDLTAEAASEIFTVDSTKPSLSEASFSASAVSIAARALPFIRLQVSGIKDSVSPIESVCVKILDQTEPLSLDPCWLGIKGLGGTESLDLSAVSLPKFAGFQSNSAFVFYLWAKDKAGNISTLVQTTGKDKTTLAYTAPTASATTGYWDDSATATTAMTVSIDATASTTIQRYTGAPVANDTTMIDPGTIVVDSKERIYLKDKALGIVRLNPLTETREVLVAKKASTTEGLLSDSATGVQDPIRIALDRDDGLWILDQTKIVYVDTTATQPSLVWIAGGGTQEGDELNDAKQLKITPSDNLRWFGSFAVLPDKSVVFHSSDPNKPLNHATSASRMKLRILKGATRKIETLYLAGDITENGLSKSVDSFYPFGPMAFTWDPARLAIKNVFGRFCEQGSSGTTCTARVLKFDGTGEAIGPLSLTQAPYLYNNFPMITRNNVDVFGFNGIKSFLTQYSESAGNWTKLVGYNQRASAFCDNGTASTSCNVRLTDLFVNKNGLVYFLDATRVRVQDLDGTIQTIYQPAP